MTDRAHRCRDKTGRTFHSISAAKRAGIPRDELTLIDAAGAVIPQEGAQHGPLDEFTTKAIDALGQRMARDLEGLLFVGDCERPTPTQDTPQ